MVSEKLILPSNACAFVLTHFYTCNGGEGGEENVRKLPKGSVACLPSPHENKIKVIIKEESVWKKPLTTGGKVTGI